MKVEYKFLGVINDNDSSYFSMLEGLCDSIDPDSAMTVIKGSNGYHFRLIPSSSNSIDHLVREITTLSSMVGVQLELSKSIKSTSVISFFLSL